MDEPQRMSNVPVFQSRQPASRIFGKMSDVLAHHLDEHQLGKLGQQTFASGLAASGFLSSNAKHAG